MNEKDTVLVIRPDFAKLLLAKNHTIVDLAAKRYKNSTQVDWTRCIFYFAKDALIEQDLKELIINSEKNKSRV